MGVIDTIKNQVDRTADTINTGLDNFGQGWEECLDVRTMPFGFSVPIFPNPVTGNLGCTGDLSPLGARPLASTDNPSVSLDNPIDQDNSPPSEPNIPPIPPTNPPPAVPKRPNGDPVFQPKPTTEPPLTRPPEVPPRRFESPDAFQQTEEQRAFIRPTLSQKNSALERTYGCLLFNAHTARTAKFDFSFSTRSPEDPRKQIVDWYIYQIEKIRGKKYNDNDVSGTFAINVLPTTGLHHLGGTTKEFLDYGGNALGILADKYRGTLKNAYQNIEGLARTNVEVQSVDDQRDLNIDAGTGLVDFGIQHYPRVFERGDDGCFVPISQFRKNEPPQYGMERQLQVIYQKKETDSQGNTINYEKQITIPSPIPSDSVTEGLIKTVFPDELLFGELKSETSVRPYGYIRIYLADQSQAEALFDAIFENLVNGSEGTRTDTGQAARRFSFRQRRFKTGTFKLNRAYYFDFNVDNLDTPFCRRIELS